jgi:hypothetical protein
MVRFRDIISIKRNDRLCALVVRVPAYRTEMYCASCEVRTEFTCYVEERNDTPQTPGVSLALFADDTCLYATDRKEGYVLTKIQSGLNCMAAWCERWNIKVNEEKSRAIYFTHRTRPPDSPLTLNGRNIPFLNSVKYLGVIFDRRMTWRLHIEMIEAKGLRTFIRIYYLFKSERFALTLN